MCTGVEIAMIAGAAVSAVGTVSQMNKKTSTPTPPAPEKPPQASKTPDIAAIRKKNASALTGPAAGNASTFLTGPSGIEDQMLNLGKNSLLGQ